MDEGKKFDRMVAGKKRFKAEKKTDEIIVKTLRDLGFTVVKATAEDKAREKDEYDNGTFRIIRRQRNKSEDGCNEYGPITWWKGDGWSEEENQALEFTGIKVAQKADKSIPRQEGYDTFFHLKRTPEETERRRKLAEELRRLADLEEGKE